MYCERTRQIGVLRAISKRKNDALHGLVRSLLEFGKVEEAKNPLQESVDTEYVSTTPQ